MMMRPSIPVFLGLLWVAQFATLIQGHEHKPTKPDNPFRKYQQRRLQTGSFADQVCARINQLEGTVDLLLDFKLQDFVDDLEQFVQDLSDDIQGIFTRVQATIDSFNNPPFPFFTPQLSDSFFYAGDAGSITSLLNNIDPQEITSEISYEVSLFTDEIMKIV